VIKKGFLTSAAFTTDGQHPSCVVPAGTFLGKAVDRMEMQNLEHMTRAQTRWDLFRGRHQHRTMGMFEDLCGSTASDKPLQTFPAVPAHDDQIHVKFRGRVQDFPAGSFPFAEERLRLHFGGHSTTPLGEFLRRLFTKSRLREHTLQDLQLRGDRFENVKQKQFGLKLGGKADPVGEGCSGGFRKVQRQQNSIDRQ
jgi:hypothetical protein